MNTSENQSGGGDQQPHKESREGMGGFLKRLIKDVASSRAASRERQYVSPTPAEVAKSLVAFRDLYEGTSKDVGANIAFELGKYRARVTTRDPERLIKGLSETYFLASPDRYADLEKEVPELIQAIRYEYRPPDEIEEETGMRDMKSPRELVAEVIARKLHSLKE